MFQLTLLKVKQTTLMFALKFPLSMQTSLVSTLTLLFSMLKLVKVKQTFSLSMQTSPVFALKLPLFKQTLLVFKLTLLFSMLTLIKVKQTFPLSMQTLVKVQQTFPKVKLKFVITRDTI